MTKTKKSAQTKPGAGRVDGSSIIEEEFGNYRIKAGRLRGGFVARAFPKISSNTQGLMAEVDGESEGEAIEALKALLTEREAERTAARRWEARSEISVPTKEEFEDALRQTHLSTAQQAMLKAHAIAGSDGLSIISLMNAGGYKSKETATKVLSRAGALVADFLGVEISPGAGTSVVDAARILSFQHDAEEDEPAFRIMHEELRHAVREAF